MKKFVGTLILIVCLLPNFVYAEKIYTKIAGNAEAEPGSSLVYTILLDRKLTSYHAQIEYDREILNLVDVEEVQIDTVEHKTTIEKSNPIEIAIESDEETFIVYKITFKVKNQLEQNVNKTNINITTTKAAIKEENFTADEFSFRLDLIEKDQLYIEEDIQEENSSFSQMLNSVGNVLKKYGNPILYVSLGFNVLLLIILMSSIRRKKVDYDF